MISTNGVFTRETIYPKNASYDLRWHPIEPVSCRKTLRAKPCSLAPESCNLVWGGGWDHLIAPLLGRGRRNLVPFKFSFHTGDQIKVSSVNASSMRNHCPRVRRDDLVSPPVGNMDARMVYFISPRSTLELSPSLSLDDTAFHLTLAFLSINIELSCSHRSMRRVQPSRRCQTFTNKVRGVAVTQ